MAVEEDDLSGPVQSLRENYRGHVFDVQKKGDEIHVHVPKDSPLSLPKTYRGFNVKRVERDQQLPKRADRTDAGEPTRGDIDLILRALNRVDERFDAIEARLAKLEGPPATEPPKKNK